MIIDRYNDYHVRRLLVDLVYLLFRIYAVVDKRVRRGLTSRPHDVNINATFGYVVDQARSNAFSPLVDVSDEYLAKPKPILETRAKVTFLSPSLSTL